MALRWFNGLRKGSIRSFVELILEFGARFITCSLVPQPVHALLSIKIGVGETLRSYTSRYWELYNEICGGNEKKLQQALLEWDYPRIQSFGNH